MKKMMEWSAIHIPQKHLSHIREFVGLQWWRKIRRNHRFQGSLLSPLESRIQWGETFYLQKPFPIPDCFLVLHQMLNKHLENKEDAGQQSCIDDLSMPYSNSVVHKLQLLSRLESLCKSMGLQMMKSKAICKNTDFIHEDFHHPLNLDDAVATWKLQKHVIMITNTVLIHLLLTHRTSTKSQKVIVINDTNLLPENPTISI